MATKVADIFYKKKGQKKATYVGAFWENKFADEQRAQGREPWLDLDLSIMDGDTRIRATEIRFGSKVLKLGKEAGVYPKVGLCEGLTIGEVADVEDVAEEEDDGLAVDEL